MESGLVGLEIGGRIESLIEIGTFKTVTKILVQGLKDMQIRGREETIQTIALSKSDTIQQRVLEIWGDLLSLTLSANAGMKNS